MTIHVVVLLRWARDDEIIVGRFAIEIWVVGFPCLFSL